MNLAASFSFLLYMASYVEAYSTGAPASACETLVPVHEVSNARLLPTQQFYANLSSATYCPGEEFHVHIYGTSEGYEEFRGFLCQARMTGVAIETVYGAGTLASADPYKNLSCSFPSVTHVSNTWKTDINLIWTPNNSITTAEAQIVCTIVIDYSTYVLDITTPRIPYGQEDCTSGVHSENSTMSCEPWMYYNLTQQACIMCPAGYFCQDNTPIICPAGYYCLEGTIVPAPCPLGTYEAVHSATQVFDCLPCPCGMYCDSIASILPTGACNAGYFCIEGAVSATPTDGMTGDICSPESFCPIGSCNETACKEGDNCASTVELTTHLTTATDTTTASGELTTHLATATDTTTASGELTTHLATATDTTTASGERTTHLATATDTTTASVELTTHLATATDTTTASGERTTHLATATDTTTASGERTTHLATATDTTTASGELTTHLATATDTTTASGERTTHLATATDTTTASGERTTHLATATDTTTASVELTTHLATATDTTTASGERTTHVTTATEATTASVEPTTNLTTSTETTTAFVERTTNLATSTETTTAFVERTTNLATSTETTTAFVERTTNLTTATETTTAFVERTTNLTTATETTTAFVERTTNLTTSTETTTAFVERTTNLTTSTETTTAFVERTTNLAITAETTTESVDGTTTQTITNPCDCLPPDPPENGNVDIVFDEIMEAVFTCDAGYEFEFPDISKEKTYVIHCSCGEWLGFTNVTCVPIDCGGNATLDNGYIYYGDGTTYGAASVFICNIGYQLDGLSSAVCMASGQWSRPIPDCVLVDCGLPREPINGFILDPPANSTIDTTFNSVITYECNTGFLMEGHKSRRCLSSGVWSGHIPLCVKVLVAKLEPCETHVDNRGTVWHTSPPGMVSLKSCSNGYQGTVSRNCTVLGQWLLPYYNCVRETLDEITKLVEGATENPSGSLVSTILTNLSHVTTSGADDVLYDEELRVVTTTLENIVVISQNITIDDQQKQNFIRTASNLVDKKNIDSWKAINQETELDNDNDNGPAGVLRAVAGYSEVIANTTTGVTEIKEQNIVFRVANYTNDRVGEIRFPASVLAEELQTSSFYCLSNASLEGVKQYSTVFYKNLTDILPTSTSRNYSRYEINGAILSLKLIPYKNHLETPLELHFQHFNTFYKNPVCSYWNFESNGWDNEGCTMTSTNSEVTNCKCNHLTNFAILMSPYKQDVSKALNIISITGCGISLIGLALTVVLHVAFWRYVKSERAVLVLCLSVSLIVFYIIFIAGVERTDNKDACTATAVLLHYCLLVVFFMMLAASVQIAFSVLYVFATKVKKIKWLLPIALGVPAVIVTISASATKLDGYGTEDYCWLATDGGVIWAFIGPALFVICVNIILLILILKTMHSTKFVSQKSGADKIKSTVKCICVLLPVMGVTWILGLFYINDDTNWIQYLFAICNSIQGLVIFIFHCALNKQIHKGFLLTKRRYSVETSESRLANQMKRIKMKDTL